VQRQLADYAEQEGESPKSNPDSDKGEDNGEDNPHRFVQLSIINYFFVSLQHS
jgi:hypothetical protein